MRKIILIILILSAIPAYSQKYLEGHYFNPNASLHAEEFYFRKDGSFKYSLSDDLAHVILGEGRYKLKDDELVLYYEQIDTLKYINNEIIILDSSVVKDSAHFKLYVIDKFNNLPLIGGIVRLIDSNYKKINDITYLTNDSGIVEFTLNNILNPIILQIRFNYYEDSFFYPVHGVNYNLKLYLSLSYYSYEFIKAGTVSSFEYEYNTEESFYIGSSEEEYWTLFTKRERKFDE